MPQIISVGDQNTLVPTSKYPHLSFPFDHFNPVQSRVIDFCDGDANMIIAAKTSAGKTVCAEMLIGHEHFVRGGKGMYVGPLKALSQEKIDDWTDTAHDFSNLNLSICTGDYRLTKDRRAELMSSDIVLMTSEMLNSRARNYQAEQNEWLTQVGTVVTDESHLLTVPKRGDKLEIAITKMASLNRDCRHIFLSATMPNVEEIAGWLSKLTDRDTVVLRSEYRPCPLKVHYPTYNDMLWKYDWKEQEKVKAALEIVRKHPEDKFLVFAHSKRTGEMMREALKAHKIDTEFHNADLEKNKRVKLEHRFRNDAAFRVIIATSTLAWGLNMPARRVIILGVHRGLEEVETYDIEQMSGRAGRPKYDKQGDVYILMPSSDQGRQRLRLENPARINSQLVKFGSDNHDVLAFHIVSEIHQGTIKTFEDIYKWYDSTLASFQRRHLEESLVEDMIERLQKSAIIKDEDGQLTVTALGKIASLFYFWPYDVADLRQNFHKLFEYEKEYDEVWVAGALGRLSSSFEIKPNAAEMADMEGFNRKLTDVAYALGKNEGYFSPGARKLAFCYFCLMKGHQYPTFAGAMRGLKADCERLFEVLKAVDGMSAKWNKTDYLRLLQKKVMNGMDWKLADLCGIKGIGAVKAKKLWEAGIKSADDVMNKPKLTQSILKCSDAVLKKMLTTAQDDIRPQQD